ncbi:MAG: Nif3-like dinuclear metal center hexameric protein [Bacteroidia bacterium]|nr:Nif3-like dinuclear metal center hexameric protein [Bacteroidia bacterium]
MKLSEIISVIEEFAPLSFQESYDNSGLIIGNVNDEIKGALLSIDITEEIIDEAIRKNCNLVISHHPLIFHGIKKLTGDDYTGRSVIKAVKSNIAVYAAHTNIDSVIGGVSHSMCEKLGMINCRILSAKKGELIKLVTFVPISHADEVRNAIFAAGAGNIGNYSSCSFNSEGTGSFKASELANPFTGNIDELHFEKEIRLETIIPVHLVEKVLKALIDSHPYEEVAYDVYPLTNQYDLVGLGMIGEFNEEMTETDFLAQLKNVFKTGIVRHTKLLNKKIKKVAVCGGSGVFLLKKAIQSGVDVFVTADVKYHEFFDADGRILLADIGHYESEQYIKEVIYALLVKNLPNFAVCFSELNSNPVNYF